jgi:hypothetical protein
MYLNCSRCGLSLHTSRFTHIEPEYCPRCVARARVLQPLFRSSMIVRDLSAKPNDENNAPGPAPDASALFDPDAA